MKTVLAAVLIVATVLSARAADDVVDRLSDALQFGTRDGAVGARISGQLDLEGYRYQLPPPALIYADGNSLFNPRLSLFLDAQLGSEIYVFVQTRADRGFDPGDRNLQLRLDEYAARYSLGGGSWFNMQVGKFATVVGNWVGRHDSWSNPLINAPLIYENLTGFWDSVAVKSEAMLLRWAHRVPGGFPEGSEDDKDRRLPVIWGPSYATGVAVSGRLAQFQYAMELKNSALSSRPDYWDVSEQQWQNPTVSGRLGYQPNEAWDLGLSASSGCYLSGDANDTLPLGRKRQAYRETVFGQDTAFAWHHFQAWAEIYWARFEIPGVGNADTVSYYTELKYKFSPQWSGALRWNQQFFGMVHDADGHETAWGNAVWRLDLAPGYRMTAHSQLKVQYSLQHTAGDAARWSRILAVQTTVKF